MNTTIRPMRPEDKPYVMEMMRDFYTSPAVFTNGSDEIFSRDIDNCVNDNPYIEGYIFEDSETRQGYAMVAKSFSAEFGKPCIWIEDLYITAPHRGKGIGKQFLDFITTQYTDCVFRLEVEEENVPALRLYKKCGFTILPYMEMKR